MRLSTLCSMREGHYSCCNTVPALFDTVSMALDSSTSRRAWTRNNCTMRLRKDGEAHCTSSRQNTGDSSTRVVTPSAWPSLYSDITAFFVSALLQTDRISDRVSVAY